MTLVLTALFAFVSSCLITWIIKNRAHQFSLIDVPNHRSSHAVATPRGGGLSIVISFSGCLAFSFLGVFDLPTVLVQGLLFAGLLIACVSFVDDRFGLEVSIRFIAHASIFVFLIIYFDRVPELPFPFGVVSNQWVLYPLYALALVWLTNLFNFMDGIDGIAASQAMSVCLGGAAIFFWLGHSQIGFLLIFLLMACMGFLIWNWPPATIFMGDVGSVYLGFLFGALALYTSNFAGVSLWTWVVLLSVFWVDATVTLIWRMSTGQRWREAHRSHLYQVMARRWGSHKKVTVMVILINALWVIPGAMLTVVLPKFSLSIAVLVALPLAYLVIKYGTQKE